jgi:hypothetical protein
MNKFKVGQIWKDKEGHNWLILMMDKNSMCCWCGSRISQTISYLNLDGTHKTNDGCHLTEFVGDFKRESQIPEHETKFTVKVDYAGHQFLTVEANNELEARAKAREMLKQQKPEAYIRSTEIIKGEPNENVQA